METRFPGEIFAIDFATLAREIAMDIFPLEQVLELHKLSEEEWRQIQAHPKFIAMLASMQLEWSSAGNTRERVKVKSATGLESMLEVFIRDINDPDIPLAQRVEAGKFLAKLGELDQSRSLADGGGVVINIVTGATTPPITIEAKRIHHDPASHVFEQPIADD